MIIILLFSKCIIIDYVINNDNNPYNNNNDTTYSLKLKSFQNLFNLPFIDCCKKNLISHFSQN